MYATVVRNLRDKSAELASKESNNKNSTLDKRILTDIL